MAVLVAHQRASFDEIAEAARRDSSEVDRALETLANEGLVRRDAEGAELLPPCRLTFHGLLVLALLGEADRFESPPTMAEIATILGISRPTVSTFLGRLERFGFIVADRETGGGARVVRTPPDDDLLWRRARALVAERVANPFRPPRSPERVAMHTTTVLVYRALLQATRDNLRPPSLRELGAATGLSHTACANHIELLKRERIVRPIGTSGAVELRRLPDLAFFGAEFEDAPALEAESRRMASDAVSLAAQLAQFGQSRSRVVAFVSERLGFSQRLVAEVLGVGVEPPPVGTHATTSATPR